ncbi:hypothetical protein SAMN02745165_01718 [Malonomonas rubra DSM 5091]|uniref:Uncharacterized protein n=1 Tax=Malonomonas rubra DSM 5091 TaxID=1122189 RepID=A0A1M6H7F2_MALRU|nr:hypothetical protein [Malonomonas rubra]SHJ18132.1 hypothetical protein SAMN02745165_01718 [Malonomonas rubra DSM 5091]
MPRTRLFVLFITALTLLLAVLLAQGIRQAANPSFSQRAEKKALVATLGLTDLSIWSEARYTRHPSQADLFTPFQDYPGAFDHFPAGSIIAPGQPKPQTTLSFKQRGEQ